MRRLLSVLLLILVMAGLAATWRHDLAVSRQRQGRELLAAGDPRGALELLRRAERGGLDSAELAFDAGMALYRLGAFPLARERFARASGAAEPGLRAAALYNLGNCAFRLGEKERGGDHPRGGVRLKEGGEQQQGGVDRQGLLQEAARRYGEVLALAPAADARHNLAVVRSRLAGPPGAPPAAPSGEAKPGNESAASGAAPKGNQGAEGNGGSQASREQRGETPREAAGRPQHSLPDAPGRAGKGPSELTKDAAERLLNEARGREANSGPLASQRERGRQARPDRDW
jgi:tetratricopeptide (TPR) repeat protein